MRLVMVAIEQAKGGVLVHNIGDAQGHKALPKGHRLTTQDLETLRALGRDEVYVALLDADDVRENEAVARIARAAAGELTSSTTPASGRVNVLAATRGLVKLNADVLTGMNAVEGVTIATLATNAVVEPQKILATIKTIGLALSERALQAVEGIARVAGPAVWLRPLGHARVAVILTGSEVARERVEQTYSGPIRARVETLGGEITGREYVAEAPEAISAAITQAAGEGADCIILAGETSIMDADDMTPRGIKAAGGVLEVFGAPVEPGNLLLLAYRGDVPIMGAPGCIRSAEANVVDMVLPRLLAGERVTRADIIALADGGLLL